MPIYKIRDDETGTIHQVEMDSVPTAEDIDEIFSHPVAIAAAKATVEKTPFTRMEANAQRYRQGLPTPLRTGAYVAEQAGAVAGVIPYYGGKVLSAGLQTTGIPQAMAEVGGKLAQTGFGKAVAPLALRLADFMKGAGRTYKQLPPDVQELGQGAFDVASMLPIGAGTKAVGAVVSAKTGEVLTKIAPRMENVTLKIGTAEARHGAKMENIGKYGLFGSAEKVQQNALGQIRQNAAELKATIAKAAEDPLNNTNMIDILDNVEKRALETTDFGRSKVRKEITAILDDLSDKHGNKIENMDLAEAQILKRNAGLEGDWYESPMGGKLQNNSNVKSKVYNILYDELKTTIENKGGPAIKELNKKLSDLIPLERVAAKRALVASRKNPLSLDDLIGGLTTAATIASGNVLPAVLAGANVISKSPNVARAAYSTGQTLKRVGETYKGQPIRLGDLLKMRKK
jgi:hypothetical protein